MSRTPRPKTPKRVLKNKRLVIVVAVVLAVVGLGAAGYFWQTARHAPSWQELGRTAAKERQYAQAVGLYKQFLEYRPKDADAHFELAGVYDDWARVSLSRPREASRLWDEALSEYHIGLQQDTRRHEERRKLARLYLILQKPQAARKEIDLLLKEDSLKGDPELYEMLAVSEGTATPAAKLAAADHLRRGIKAGQAPPDMYLRLAYLLKRDIATPPALQEADEVMQALVTARPNDLPARLARARYHFDFEHPAEARDDIKTAYEKIPGGRENVDVILAHADAVAAQNLAEARDILQQGLKVHPDHPQIGMGLAEVESRGGNKAKARELLAAVLDRLPAAETLILDVGDRLLDLGDPDAANRAADRLAATPALEPLASYLRGRVKLAQGDWPNGLPLLRQAVVAVDTSRTVRRKAPLLHKAYMALAVGYGLANDLEQQQDAYHRAAAADQGSVPARLGWAETLAKLGRTPEAVREYTKIAPNSPAARVALANLKLSEELAGRTGGGGKLTDFWAHVGTGPYPPELAPAVATAYAAEGKTDEAERVLEAALREKPTAQAFALLAGLKAGQGKDAALAVLNRADKALGPTADGHLARAAVLARDPKPDTAAIAALAAADKLPPADRTRLKAAVGELLLSLDAPDKGLPLLQQVAAEQKYDLNVRVTLFDWALAKKDAALRDRVLAEIRTLDTDPDADGGKGAIALVAEVMHELAERPKPTREANRSLTARLLAAQKKRDGWSRIPRMLGILAAADGRPDDAATHYDEAVKLGDRSESLVRELVRLHFAKGRYADARRVLQAVRQKGGLSQELERQYQVLVAVAGGDPAKAQELATSKELTTSKNHQDHLLRAQVLARFGKEPEAQRALDTALQIAPAAPEVFVAKVRVKLLLGVPADKLRPEIAAAADILRKGNPTGSAAPLALGRMWEMAGDTAAAATEYAAAVAADPTDRDAPALLLAAYRRSDNRTAADALLSKLANGPDPDLRRWAKRMQAAALLAGPDGMQNVPAAVKLLDENLAEGNRGDDLRAKGFALCADPLQRQAGLQLIDDARRRSPLPADDAFRLAGVLLEGGRFADAEKELLSATESGLLADPAHLVLLNQVQVVRNDLAAAARTVARLKAVAPARPETLLEEARVQAKTDPAKAAERVLAIPVSDPDPLKPLRRGRWLESVGCIEAAEKQYVEYHRGTDPPAARLTALAEFYVRTGRGEKALAVLTPAAGGKDLPADALARLMVAAVRSRPADPTGGWENAVGGVLTFMAEHAAGHKASGDWKLLEAELEDARGRVPEAIGKYADARDLFANSPKKRAIAQNNWVALSVLNGAAPADLLRPANEVIAAVGPQPFALDTRGQVHLAANRVKEATDDLEAAVAFAATPTTLFHLARCYRKLDQPDRVRDALDRAKLLGLKREGLHPLERQAFDELVR